MRQIKIQQSFTNRSEKSIEQYFNDVNRIDSITPERELELSFMIKEGNQDALNELVKANLKFVISVAKKYQNTGIPLTDLINEGNIGLIKAAEKFDGTRGFKFISFAVWWIRQSIIQSISDKKRIVKIPVNKNLELGRFLKSESELQQVLQREPTENEIFEYMDINVESGNFLVQANLNSKSLDAKVNSDESSSSLIDLISDDNNQETDSSLIDESLKSDIVRALKILNTKELFIITHTYGIGCTVYSKSQIAEKLGFTDERVRQITKKAQEKLAKNTYTKKMLIKYL